MRGFGREFMGMGETRGGSGLYEILQIVYIDFLGPIFGVERHLLDIVSVSRSDLHCAVFDYEVTGCSLGCLPKFQM